MATLTISTIIAIAFGWATLIAVFTPPLIMTIRRVGKLAQAAAAPASHRHDEAARPPSPCPRVELRRRRGANRGGGSETRPRVVAVMCPA